MRVRTKSEVSGIVQGVGFRPFVYRLATERDLCGRVRNTESGVEIEAEGEDDAVRDFLSRLVADKPPLAVITRIDTREVPPVNAQGFVIEPSRAGDARRTLISPDICVCDDCLRELFDPEDRRYRYPFINCTNCGPRFTIVQDIPYDRPNTTMKPFVMCGQCQAEYDDPADRRFHAQPNACWECGPSLALVDADGEEVPVSDPILEVARMLRDGLIVAVKGLGGFHLAVDATNDEAVARLRARKKRDEKPFAVMSPDIAALEKYVELSDAERNAVGSLQRPILLAKKKDPSPISGMVAPSRREHGVMLPYTPVHYLLLQEGFLALVMTSGNISDEPITYENDEARARLDGIADYFLVHNRKIHVKCDDSVMRVSRNEPVQLRRSRGHAPRPVFLELELPQVLACGAELKNAICLTKGAEAFPSQHIGDVKNLETYEHFISALEHFERILDIHPEIIAFDMHPDYLCVPANFGVLEQERYKDLKHVAVQHHHAHIAGCMAERGLDGEVIGLAMDGTGYGPDDAIWGGEVLVADLRDYQRVGHLDYVPLPGGDAAAQEPWRMAVSYLYSCFGRDLFEMSLDVVKRIGLGEVRFLVAMIERGVNSPKTSSCGRLFDAVAALLGVRDVMSYEGQAACELEWIADPTQTEPYEFAIRDTETDKFVISVQPTIERIVEEIRAGKDDSTIAGRFHATLARAFADACARVRELTGLQRVVLSGGCFQNSILTGKAVAALAERGFAVYTHRAVPPNDGGVSLGQAVVAGLSE